MERRKEMKAAICNLVLRNHSTRCETAGTFFGVKKVGAEAAAGEAPSKSRTSLIGPSWSPGPAVATLVSSPEGPTVSTLTRVQAAERLTFPLMPYNPVTVPKHPKIPCNYGPSRNEFEEGHARSARFGPSPRCESAPAHLGRTHRPAEEQQRWTFETSAGSET